MNWLVQPGRALRGEVWLLGDKSISHRAALLAALADGASRIKNFLVSGVTRDMLNALTNLGVSWQLEQSTLTVDGKGIYALHSPSMPLNCGNSATTLRLLAGALAAANVSAVLDGSPGLRRRPMRRIIEPLRMMGVQIDATDGHAPIILRNRIFPLRGIDYTLPIASAQVKSCLLLAALAGEDITLSLIHISEPTRPY